MDKQNFEYKNLNSVFVSQVEFFKATSSGGLDPVENSTSSLHYRRSIIIKDDINSTLWLIHGSGVAKKTKKTAETKASQINEENHGAYKIEEIDYDDAKDKINELLSADAKPKSKRKKKKVGVDTIPSVPSLEMEKDDEHTPVGDKDVTGPEIKEFQIAYYVEDEVSTKLSDEVKEQLVIYEQKVLSLIKDRPNKKTAKKSLDDISKQLISLIYD